MKNIISKFNNFIKNTKDKVRSTSKINDSVYSVELFKALDEKIDDKYDRITCSFVENNSPFNLYDRSFLIYLYVKDKIAKIITLKLVHMACVSIDFTPEDKFDLVLHNFIALFLDKKNAIDMTCFELEEADEDEGNDLDFYHLDDLDDEYDIEEIDESISKNYKALYVTPLELDKTYCQFLSMYPKEMRKCILEVCNVINSKYKDILVTKITRRIQPGVIILDGNIQHIATDIYHIFNKHGIDVRIVYGEGKMETITNDIHSSHGDLVIRIGRYSDKLKGKKGIFKESSIK